MILFVRSKVFPWSIDSQIVSLELEMLYEGGDGLGIASKSIPIFGIL